jgi:hypothetical protein
MKQDDGTHADYLGGTLATAIREKVADRPVVLITRKGLLVWQSHRNIVEKSGIFDDVIYKEDINKDAGRVVRHLKLIADGFRILRQKRTKNWKALINALEATKNEESLLREANPPASAWQVLEAAQWIRNVVLAYPGILYDPLHAATALGIEKNAFLGERVQKLVKGAKYTGIFAPPEGRWWRGRLFEGAGELIRKQRIQGPINQGFVKAFKKQYKQKLPLAKCVYSGETPADWVCYVLKQPVRIEYSLVYHPDSRPAVMDDARVSFKAIRESNEVFDELFDAESAKLLKEIRARPNEKGVTR